MDAVKHLAPNPHELAGLISGIKGKLFEIDYIDWLNHGHLPDGWTAELAHSANNPAWDIAIHDGHGHVAELLQVKATESLAYVREAIAAHPEIDVVVPKNASMAALALYLASRLVGRNRACLAVF